MGVSFWYYPVDKKHSISAGTSEQVRELSALFGQPPITLTSADHGSRLADLANAGSCKKFWSELLTALNNHREIVVGVEY
jgi:hypothetical protein